MVLTWWRQLVGRKSRGLKKARRPPDHPRWQPVKLSLEQLEDRLAPALVTLGSFPPSNGASPLVSSSSPAGNATPQTAAVQPQHLALANRYVEDVAVPGAYNHYGLPAAITYVNGVIHARTECAQLVRLVLEHSYASVTGTVLKGLTGSTQPNSAQFHDAIAAQATYVQGTNTFAFHARSEVSAILPGDILAAKYASHHGSGHTMLVNTITLVGSNVTGVFAGVGVNEYRVQVIDSASGPHTGAPGFPDSRGSHGEGIGSGYILVYENAQTGALLGWTWTTRQRTPYQGTDPAGSQYRPMVAGYLTGPGIGSVPGTS